MGPPETSRVRRSDVGPARARPRRAWPQAWGAM